MRSLLAWLLLVGVCSSARFAFADAAAAEASGVVATEQVVRLQVTSNDSGLATRIAQSVGDYSRELGVRIEARSTTAEGANAALNLARAAPGTDGAGVLAAVAVALDDDGATIWIAADRPRRLWRRRVDVVDDPAEAVEQVGVVVRWAIAALLERTPLQMEAVPVREAPPPPAPPRPSAPPPLPRAAPALRFGLAAAYAPQTWSAHQPLQNGVVFGGFGCAHMACAGLGYAFRPAFALESIGFTVELVERPLELEGCVRIGRGKPWWCPGLSGHLTLVERTTVHTPAGGRAAPQASSLEGWLGPSVRIGLPLVAVFELEARLGLEVGLLRQRHAPAGASESSVTVQDLSAAPVRGHGLVGVLARIW